MTYDDFSGGKTSKTLVLHEFSKIDGAFAAVAQLIIMVFCPDNGLESKRLRVKKQNTENLGLTPHPSSN